MTKKRTFWPVGILLIIALGIALIVVSIRISTKQSIDTDKTFGLERTDVDTNINEIMAYQNRFEKEYTPYIGINTMDFTEKDRIVNPYYITAVPKDYPPEQERLKDSDNIIYLKINRHESMFSYLDLEAFVFNFQVVLELTRLGKDDKKATTITLPMTIAQRDSTKTIIYKTEPFSLPLTGYYQARFRITDPSLKSTLSHNQHNDDKSKQEQEKAKTPEIFFYHWIFNKNPQ